MLAQRAPRIVGNATPCEAVTCALHLRPCLLVQALMSCGKKSGQTLTFGWEVGLALSLVGPVYHQVPEATETVSDLIYESTQAQWENER